jgi:predicted transposase YbfD/YdcC
MTDSPSIVEHFSSMTDPRVERTRLHKLTDIIAIAICAAVCGADDFVEIEEFGRAREDWLRERLELPNGIPSHDTFGRVFSRLDPKEFGECFLSWTQALRQHTTGEFVAVDGKATRGSFDEAAGKSAIHMVSAWASESRLVLGQVKVDDKSNEITAIPELLRILDISGCIVTIDAMGCQREIAARIIGQCGDYVFSLKGNQCMLHDDVKVFFEDSRSAGFKGIEHTFDESVDKGHGRTEIRRCWVSTNVGWLDERHNWPGLASIAAVECERHLRDKVSIETRYFISSLDDNAQKIQEAVRSHWGIENQLHWVLDVVFREDHCRTRKDHAPQNLATLRHIALNLLKQDKSAKVGIKARRLKAALDIRYMESILTN